MDVVMEVEAQLCHNRLVMMIQGSKSIVSQSRRVKRIDKCLVGWALGGGEGQLSYQLGLLSSQSSNHFFLIMGTCT